MFLFNTVIYVSLLLCVCILIVCLCIFIVPTGTLRLPWLRFFHAFFLSCKANARVKPAKMGHGSHSSKIFVLFYVLFVVCRSVYCLCVYMCTVLLPLGGYTIAVNKYLISIRSFFFFFLGVWLTPTVPEGVPFHTGSFVPHNFFCHHNQWKPSWEVGVEMLAPRFIIFWLRYAKKLPPPVSFHLILKSLRRTATSRSHMSDTVIFCTCVTWRTFAHTEVRHSYCPTVWAGGRVTTNCVVRRLFYYFFDFWTMFTSALQGLDVDV